MLCSVGLQATWMNIILKNMWPQYNQGNRQDGAGDGQAPAGGPAQAGLPFDSHSDSWCSRFAFRFPHIPPFFCSVPIQVRLLIPTHPAFSCPILVPGVAGLPFDSHTRLSTPTHPAFSCSIPVPGVAGLPFDSHTSHLFLLQYDPWCTSLPGMLRKGDILLASRQSTLSSHCCGKPLLSSSCLPQVYLLPFRLQICWLST